MDRWRRGRGRAPATTRAAGARTLAPALPRARPRATLVPAPAAVSPTATAAASSPAAAAFLLLPVLLVSRPFHPLLGGHPTLTRTRSSPIQFLLSRFVERIKKAAPRHPRFQPGHGCIGDGPSRRQGVQASRRRGGKGGRRQEYSMSNHAKEYLLEKA